jgi:hypothetical protein
MIQTPLSPAPEVPVPTKKTSTKSRSRAAKKISVRDLAPKKKKGAVKGGGEHTAISYSKIGAEIKPR